MSECQSLRDRFSELKRKGLTDVKFLLRSTDDATVEAVCAEVNAMLTAYDSGRSTPLDLEDGYHRR